MERKKGFFFEENYRFSSKTHTHTHIIFIDSIDQIDQINRFLVQSSKKAVNKSLNLKIFNWASAKKKTREEKQPEKKISIRLIEKNKKTNLVILVNKN